MHGTFTHHLSPSPRRRSHRVLAGMALLIVRRSAVCLCWVLLLTSETKAVVEAGPDYSATWEKEFSVGFNCSASSVFDNLLSATGSFQAGRDDSGCDADLRGVLEFDLLSLPTEVAAVQLIMAQEGGSETQTLLLHGFSGNGSADQADANVEDVIAQFAAPGVGGSVTVDVTAFLATLLSNGATHAGFTIAGGTADLSSFAGLGDAAPPQLHVIAAPSAVPALTGWMSVSLALGMLFVGIGLIHSDRTVRQRR